MIKYIYNLIRKNFIVIILSLLFILLIVLYYHNSLEIVDTYLYSKLYFNNTITTMFKIITWFGSVYAFLIITIIAVFILKDKRKNILIITNLIISFTANYIFKLLLKRSRPININLIEEIGYSMPSGHTTVSTAFYGLIIYLIYKSKLPIKIKNILIIILISLIILIGISRIYLGVHFSTDIITSYILASIYLILFIKITEKIK